MIEPDFDNLFFDEHGQVDIAQRNLPHWRQEGKLYFVTWRQADSLPQALLEQLREERKAWERAHGDRPVSSLPLPLREEHSRLFGQRVENWLDAGFGSCVMRHTTARQIMAEALHHFHGARYRLGSFAIAGNHVHALVAPFPQVTLSRVLHTWKSFSANEINKTMGRTGRLWMDETYDRLIRDPAHLANVERYIVAHAEKGGHVERRHI